MAGQPLDTTWNSDVSLKLVCPKAVGFDVTRGTPKAWSIVEYLSALWLKKRNTIMVGLGSKKTT